MNPNQKIRPLPSNRPYRSGDRIYVVGPMFVARGRLEKDKCGELLYRGDDWAWGVMLMPFSSAGKCTYSTHTSWKLARLSDRAVAAEYRSQQRKREADAARKRIQAMSDDDILELAA